MHLHFWRFFSRQANRFLIAGAFAILGITMVAEIVGTKAKAQDLTDARARFQPAEVFSGGEAVYPIKSLAVGTVVLNVSVSKNGRAKSVKVVRDIPSLTEPAETAVMKWKFRPAMLDGEPVESVVPVAVSFVREDLFPRNSGE
jgi:Gram-negative bacterial TonB protein C-terminal